MTDKEPTQEQIIREFLARIEDKTGVVRRYAEYLKNKPTWEEEATK